MWTTAESKKCHFSHPNTPFAAPYQYWAGVGTFVPNNDSASLLLRKTSIRPILKNGF